jgi:hypothetical protein
MKKRLAIEKEKIKNFDWVSLVDRKERSEPQDVQQGRGLCSFFDLSVLLHGKFFETGGGHISYPALQFSVCQKAGCVRTQDPILTFPRPK